MIYKVYEKYKEAYYKSQEEFHEVLNEKERLFSKTQPQSTDYNKDKSSGGKTSNAFDNYLISVQEKDIDNKLNRCRKIMLHRKLLLENKEEELRKSKNEYDIIYKYHFLDCLSIRQIEKKSDVFSSKSEIDRKIQKIKKDCNLGQNGTKVML